MRASDGVTFLRLAVVLDDPGVNVSTEGLFAVVTSAGDVAIGPASEIGDIAEWVFDAESDSFERAFDLVHLAVLRHMGDARGLGLALPDQVKVFAWSAGDPVPAPLAAWDRMRRPAVPVEAAAVAWLGTCACGAPALRQAFFTDQYPARVATGEMRTESTEREAVQGPPTPAVHLSGNARLICCDGEAAWRQSKTGWPSGHPVS